MGRKCSEKELKRETPVFKDLDIMEQKQKLHVKKEMQLLLLEQLSIDCAVSITLVTTVYNVKVVRKYENYGL